VCKCVRFLQTKLELLFICTRAVWTTDRSWNVELYILYREYSTDIIPKEHSLPNHICKVKSHYWPGQSQRVPGN